jgi:virginiamycin A acetyltransferase
MKIIHRPNPNEAFPNPNIIVGDYTYYDDVDSADQFEKHVTHLYGFIGDGAIIGANSVVASDIPPYSVAVGNPCRVVRKWWDKDIEEIESLMPLLSCSDLEKVKAELKAKL